MASPDELMRSVGEFRDLLNSLGSQGVSQIAEVAQLSVLIKKYPGTAPLDRKQAAVRGGR